MNGSQRSPRALGTIGLTLVGLLLSLPWPVAAQERPPDAAIVGRVVEAVTGEPLVAAMVRLIEAHRSEPSHEDGGFGFRRLRPGPHTVVVERIGYQSSRMVVELEPGETRTLRIELRVSAVRLGELVVTGTIGTRSGEDVLSPTSVLSGSKLDRRLGGTVAATVEQEPGVAVSSLGPATARPVIRGLGGDRIVLLEDGARTGDLSSTSSDHAVALEPLSARRFEVVRGPMSLLYGSSALGGVVNVVREEIPEAKPDDLHGGVVLQGATVNSATALGAFVTAPAGPLAMRAEANARRTGDVSTPAGDLPNTDASTYGASLAAALTGRDGHIGAAYRFYDSEYGIPGGFVGGHAQGVDIDMRRHSIRGQAELHDMPGHFSRLKAQANYSDYQHAELAAGGAVGTQFTQDLFAADLLAYHGEGGDLANGAVGARFQYRDIRTGGSLRTPSTYDWNVAGYLVEELGRGDLRVQLGARYDYGRYTPRDTTQTIFAGGRRIPIRPRSFGSFSGSVGALYRVAEHVRLGGSVARAYRTPDFNELYSSGPHLAANSFDVGDPTLEAETGLGVDLFARVTGEQLSGEAAVFVNWLNEYIFPSSRGRIERGTQGNVPRFQYTNEDARFEGVEGRLELSPANGWVLSGTASYVRALFTSVRDSIPVFENGDTILIAASRHPPLIPPLRATVGARHERPSWFAGADVRLSQEQERVGDFETPTEGYALLDVDAGIRFYRWGRAHSVTLRVENATNESYRDHLSRIKEIMPEPGRNVSLLYRLVF